MIETLLVCFIAGAGAGIGTGFVGLSAATVISPMLIAFLGCPWYESVGIGLLSDVLASAGAAYTYGKSGNMDLKNGSAMLASVLVMTVVSNIVLSLGMVGALSIVRFRTAIKEPLDIVNMFDLAEITQISEAIMELSGAMNGKVTIVELLKK